VKKILLGVLIGLVAISMIAGSLVGCSSKSSSTTTTTSSAATLTEATIVVGTDSPLTGGASPWGLGVEHGVMLAAEDFNNAGGLTIGNTHYTFKVTSLDDAYDTAKATNNIRTLVNTDGVKYLFEFQPDSSVALGPELAAAKVIQFSVSSDDRCITQPANAYTFRTFDPLSLQAPSYVAWIAKNYPQVKSTAIITSNNLNGNIATAATEGACKQAGITVADEVLYDEGTTDFTPFLTKILADNPDMISIPGAPGGDVALIIKTARDSGYKGVLSEESKGGAADMLSVAGATDLEGTISDALALIAPQASTVVLGLPAREVTKWGTSYSDTWDFYTQAMIMFTAMQRAGSIDTTVVKNILQDSTQVWPYAALTGATAKFNGTTAQAIYGANATNQISNSYPVSVIHNGADTIAAIIDIP
jgi:branched-chain amino acid transport system substrate-binding protein